MAEINTKYFGKFSYSEQDCIIFPDGLFGFETETTFLLIRFAEEDETSFCLQSITDETLAFVVINPFAFIPEYAPTLSKNDLAVLQASDDADLIYYVICVMRDVLSESSANLKCPVVINPQNHLAKQVMLEDSSYSFRHSFQSFTINNTEG